MQPIHLRFVLFALLTVAFALPALPGNTASSNPVIAAGGDIACKPGSTPTKTSCQQAATGNLLSTINPAVVLPLGDNQYESGTSAEFAGSYNVVQWGADKGISRPVAGNHEYYTTGATGYYGYFGTKAGDPSKGYYSYDVTGPSGAFHWHMIALNSECAQIGGCGTGSPQEVWLKNDLAAHPTTCTLAYWHRPRFSSGATVGSNSAYKPFWTDLYNAGADVVLNGHAHDYERFAPQTPSGAADATNGIAEFVVGIGGKSFQSWGTIAANSVARNNTSFGVLKMTLHASSYDWQFVHASGYGYNDSGIAKCHGTAATDTTAPTAPSNLTATAASSTEVDLNWTASADNVGVTGYRIYRAPKGTTSFATVGTTSGATTFADTTVSANTGYDYKVTAVDAANNASCHQIEGQGRVRGELPHPTPSPGDASASSGSPAARDIQGVRTDPTVSERRYPWRPPFACFPQVGVVTPVLFHSKRSWTKPDSSDSRVD